MDDGRPNLVEVLEGVDDLHDDRAALLLAHQLILLQVEVQIIAFTVLQHCAEPATGSAVHHCLYIVTGKIYNVLPLITFIIVVMVHLYKLYAE